MRGRHRRRYAMMGCATPTQLVVVLEEVVKARQGQTIVNIIRIHVNDFTVSGMWAGTTFDPRILRKACLESIDAADPTICAKLNVFTPRFPFTTHSSGICIASPPFASSARDPFVNPNLGKFRGNVVGCRLAASGLLQLQYFQLGAEPERKRGIDCLSQKLVWLPR